MGEATASRVLVVDDAPQIRAVIRRVLNADGYDIDEAATLSQARSLAAAYYDAFVVDLRLGDGSGADLIETLVAGEPGAAARCLVLTGGGLEAVPDGTAYLRKPFCPDELLAAVRALRQRTRSDADVAGAAPQRIPPPAPQAPAGGDVPPSYRLLGMYRELLARERLTVADYLHDGPVQDLTSAVFELQMLRRTLPPGQARSLDAVRAALDAAIGSLRRLMDEPGTPAPDGDLIALLSERAAWLLSEPVTISQCRTGDVGRAEAQVLTETVALMLSGLVPAGSPARAHIGICPTGDALQVELTLTVTADGERALREPAVAQDWLSGLAAALGGTAAVDFQEERWLATLSLPRSCISS